MEKELTPKQQTSESIRQAESILILTGQHPNIDQVAAVIALSSVLKKFGKKVSAVISDDIPAGAKFLNASMIEKQLGGLRDFIMEVDLAHAEVDKIKYTIEDGKLKVHVTPFSGGFKSQDVGFTYGDYQYDLVIVLGVASYSRIDRIYSQNVDLLEDIPLVNIDFHRINEQYGAINLIEPNAAGLGEILVALSESLQTGLIDSEIATVLLTGIMASTDRFTANHTTSKALTVAAQMMANGADQKQVVRGLYGGNQKKSGARQDQPRQAGQQREAAPKQDNRPKNEPAKIESTPAKPRMQAEIYDRAGLEPGGTIRERAVFISEPTPETVSAPAEVVAPLDGEDATPNESVQTLTPEAVQAPAQNENAQKTISLPDSQPKAEDVQFEVDGPAVTDPEESIEAVIDRSDEDQPEPLINDEAPKAPKPQPQAQAQRSNPTNNPIFANRLS